MIPIKSEKDLKMLKDSGKILARVLERLQELIQPNLTTVEIDMLAEDLIEREGAVCAFKGYKGFPASVCTSINEEIVHGIPGNRRLKEGDIISLDLGVNFKGYFSDAAVTLPVGRISPHLRNLLDVTRAALSKGIQEARIDNNLSDISHTIQSHVEKNGYSVVRQFVGHGIGFQLHEDPEIPNFGRPHLGPRLKKGMVLAIEPMVNMGTWESEVLENGWTAVSKDKSPSAHFEHTVAITERGPQILTN
ncbi:MAG: type I methionyl aminopeptidase [Candidatus Omnitrophota bacterium]